MNLSPPTIAYAHAHAYISIFRVHSHFQRGPHISIISVIIVFVFVLVFFPCGIMDFLSSRDISIDRNAAELRWCLAQKLPADAVVMIRDVLFARAKGASLISEGDALVQRRKINGGRRTVVVPGALLRNGGHSKAEPWVSQVQ